MFLFDLFHSFLPLHNPIGFAAGDFLELLLAALLVVLAMVWRPLLEPRARRFAENAAWCMLLLALLPVALRVVLLPHHPVPAPDVYDEFSHLLAADTLRHFRLANPVHPMHRFFETFFVLQEPTYSSIYPIGQGLMLAIGWTLFGLPWAGVVLAVAAFCPLCYWMLRGWTTPGWALVGGMLAVIEFGPLNQWMNAYWGGALPAAAGCLVFGALPRLRNGGRSRDAVLLGLGIAIHLLTRQYESIFLIVAVVTFYVPLARRREELWKLARPAAIAYLVLLPAIAITLLQDKQVTGKWTTTPEMLSQYQYGVPTAFTIQPNVTPHRELTPQQALDYRMQRSFHGENQDTLSSFLQRLEFRVRYYRFFFLAPLYLSLAVFLWTVREYRFAWVLITVTLFALGTNLFPAFQFHYVAAVTCLFILMSVTGLERLSRLTAAGQRAGQQAARLIVFLCVAHFLFWYGLHLFDGAEVSQSLRAYESWDAINHRNPERRILVNGQLSEMPGKLLVFVRYYPQHIFQEEWVFNDADIDGARVVWARDLGAEENEKLRQYYPSRQAMLLEPDFRPPRLTAYAAGTGGPQ